MKEGGTEAPIRHALVWRDEDFYDADKLDAELRRVFDICHGCRRCFNLCDSFPRLFDLIDDAPSGELDTVGSGVPRRELDRFGQRGWPAPVADARHLQAAAAHPAAR